MAFRQQELINIQRMADDPDFKGVIENLRLEYFEQWCKERKPDARERLWLQQEVLDGIVTQMRAAADQLAFEKHRNG
tara:strand:+ start:254 stop:484 length:231 start_codon:yes stop_codon:yes gene_type:complete